MAGVAFMIAYLVLSFLIIVNMYIAVILENYSQVSIFNNFKKSLA
jgi:voltage-gated sodium channel type II alpha